MRRNRLIACLLILSPLGFIPSKAKADNSSVNISDLKVTKQGGQFHITAHGSAASLWANTQLMIDDDGDAKTGYHVGDNADNGFDVMVEGTTVYRFQGNDPTAWAWEKVGQATRKADGDDLTMDIDLGLIKPAAPPATPAALLRALSTDYQQVLATSAVATLAVKSDPAKENSPAKSSAAQASATPAGAASLSISSKQDGTNLVLKVNAKTAADLNTVLIFFDTDDNADTGFQPPADPHFGFEYMIQGGSLSQHTGAARDGWSWLTVTAVKQSVAGSSEEIHFNASLLNSNKFRVAIWQMSPDWQSRTDFFPHDASNAETAGTLDVTLDASKLRADASGLDVPMSPRHANADLPPRDRFKQAKSYCCYYGPDHVAAISHVDAAILHIPAETPADVKALSNLGVVAIGYLSVGEDETIRTGNGHGPGGKASWYFDRNHAGKPDENGTWGSYYANAADPLWRQDRVEQARHLCGNGPGDYGFDGIFLDTIETVDLFPSSRDGMIELVAELRAALPDKVIVINRGFSLLGEAAVSSKIDGLMFEDFTDSYDFSTKSYIRYAPQDMDATRATMVSTVTPAMKKYGLRALALDYVEPDQTDRIQEAFDRAVSFGMLPAVAPISLDAVYDTSHVVGKPDDRYLSKMATPQSMQIVMDADRNGFPAGTIIQPSSCYMGYTVASLVDGIQDRHALYWTKAAWASAEQPGQSQQLLILFAHPVSGGTLKITFAFDNNQYHPSQNFLVETSATEGDAWQTIVHPTSNQDSHFTCTLSNEPVHAIRITQEPGGGSKDRPDLMWIGQIERTAAQM